jgi:LCP family protein required for cell wall assembly
LKKKLQEQKKPLKKKRRGILFGMILLGVLLSIGIAVVIYINSLVKLVETPEFTGDPTIVESDMIEPGETVSQPDSVVEMKTAESENAEVQKTIPIPQDKDVYNILLIGSDNRGQEVNGRSDTMIILSINKRTKKIHMVSLMRGLYVNIPEHGYGMLNASYSYGGPKLLLQTIADNLRVQVDDYVMVNFAGFIKAINTVGGVSIKLTSAEVNYLTPVFPGAGLIFGTNELNGDIALEYARIRHIDSDYARTGRQRAVIQALIKKMTSLSVSQMDTTARQLLPLVKTNKSGTALIGLAIDGLKYRSYPIKQLMLPIEGTHRMIVVRGAQMESFDIAKNVEALQNFLYTD